MLISEKNIFLDLQGSDKYEIFKKIIDMSDISNDIKKYVFQKVKEREEIQATCVGGGIGMAHARFDSINGIGDIKVLMGIIKNGVEYDAINEQPVKIIFIILALKEKNREYLGVLSRISKICRKKEVVEKIIKSKTKEEIVNILKTFEVESN